MRTLIWLGVLPLVLAGCQQDPYRIRNTSDGGNKIDGRWVDAEVLTDQALSDGDGAGRVDFTPADPDISYDACIARPEACNNVDDNCNGQIDEGFDKLSDPRYCEECAGCNWLLALNAYPGCQDGQCVIRECLAGFIDDNGEVKDGCELECTPSGVEVCDGLDNDCNGLVDDGLTPPNICLFQGACDGAEAVCLGAQGWQCNYSPDVELLPCDDDADCGGAAKCDLTRGVCPGVVINDEARCDGLDGDCDGLADDPWNNPLLPTRLGDRCFPRPPCTGDADCDLASGSSCVDGRCTQKQGICRDEGEWICDPVTKAGLYCQITSPGLAASVETCDGVDNDCNGVVDDIDPIAHPENEQWVTVNNFQIFKYEASRPDADASNPGTLGGRACSLPGRLPWTSVSQEEARQACLALGADLCTPSEWEVACGGPGQPPYLYPYGGTFQAATCNGRAFDPSADEALPTDQPGGDCVSSWAGGDIFNMSGNIKEWVSYKDGPSTIFQIRGGAYDTPSLDDAGLGLSCPYILPGPEQPLRLESLGFRCCK